MVFIFGGSSGEGWVDVNKMLRGGFIILDLRLVHAPENIFQAITSKVFSKADGLPNCIHRKNCACILQQ
jgi:hypothetical protein